MTHHYNDGEIAELGDLVEYEGAEAEVLGISQNGVLKLRAEIVCTKEGKPGIVRVPALECELIRRQM